MKVNRIEIRPQNDPQTVSVYADGCAYSWVPTEYRWQGTKPPRDVLAELKRIWPGLMPGKTKPKPKKAA